MPSPIDIETKNENEAQKVAQSREGSTMAQIRKIDWKYRIALLLIIGVCAVLAMSSIGQAGPTGPTITLRANNTAGSTLVQPWDYVTNFQYVTDIVIDPDGTGINRTIILEAPAGMRFVLPAGKPGVTISYPAGFTTGALQGKRLLFTIANTHADQTQFDIPTIAEGASAAANQANTALAVGNAIYNHGYGTDGTDGSPTAPQSITTATASGTWNGTAPTGSLAMDYHTYRYNDMFDGLYLAPQHAGLTTNATMSHDGQIMYYSSAVEFSGHWGTTLADSNGWGLFNSSFTNLNNLTNSHNPYWNLSVKVYIPEGLRITNPDLASQIQTDAGGDYVLITDANQTPLNAIGLNKQSSPIQGFRNTGTNWNGQFYGSNAGYTNASNGATFALNLALAPALGETVTSGKVYSAPDTVVTYDTYDASGNVTTVTLNLNSPRVTTATLKNIDAYTIGSPDVDIFAGSSNNTHSGLVSPINLTNRYVLNHANYNGFNENDQHVGGTLTFDADPDAYALDGMTVGFARSNFYARGSAGGTNRGNIEILNGVLIRDALRSGLPASTNITYELEDGTTHTNAIKTIDPLDGSTGGTNWLPLPTGDPLCQNLLDDGGMITAVSFPSASDSNRVKKVTFELTKGLNLAPGWGYNFGFDITADEGLDDNVVATQGVGVHRTEIKMTLRGVSGCTIRGGAAADSVPAITGGEHVSIQPIFIRSPLDILIMQSQGVWMANSHTQAGIAAGINGAGVSEVPFLDDKTGRTSRSATLAFGYGIAGNTFDYRTRQGAWPTYYDFEMALGNTTQAEKRYLETISSFQVFATMWENARIEYTVDGPSGPDARVLTLADTTPLPSSGNLPAATYDSTGGVRDLNLAAGEYLTSFVFKADEFKVGAVHWRSQSLWGAAQQPQFPFGNTYPTQGYWGVAIDGGWRGAGINFFSHKDRDFRSDGVSIPDAVANYTETLNTFTLSATSQGALSDGGTPEPAKNSHAMVGGTLPIAFRKAAGMQIRPAAHTSFPAFNVYTWNAPTSIAQGATFNVSIRANSNGEGAPFHTPLFNSHIWAKLDPAFTVVGITVRATDAPTGVIGPVHTPDWEIVSVGGDNWLRISSPGNITDQHLNYTLQMMALPTATPGITNFFETFPFRTIDRAESFTHEWGLENGPHYLYTTGFTTTQEDVLGLYNGKNGPEEGTIYATNATPHGSHAGLGGRSINILRASVSGVQMLSGVNAALVGLDQTRMWRDPQLGQLTAYASIGGDAVIPLSNYETIFQIPRTGDSVEHTPALPDPATSTVVDHGVVLRGPIRPVFGSVNADITYQIGGSWYTEAQVPSNGGWAAVTHVKVFVASFPEGTTVAVNFDLAPDRPIGDIDIGDVSMIGARYTHSNLSGSWTTTNAARFELEGYRIGSTNANAGYAFNDMNGNNVFGTTPAPADTKRAGMLVELWEADVLGIPQGIAPVASTFTAADGTWQFTDQRAGHYVVKYVLPAGFRFATQGALATANASHVSSLTGLTGPIDVTGITNVNVAQNAGLQIDPLVRVEFRLASDNTLISSTQYNVPIGAHTATVGVTPGVNIPQYHHLATGEPTSKSTPSPLSWTAPVQTIVWLIEQDSLTITYQGNGGTTTGLVTSTTQTIVPYSLEATLTVSPFSRTGWQFLGWSTNSAATTPTYLNGAPASLWGSDVTWSAGTGTLTLYAIWQANQYTLNFDANEGVAGTTTSKQVTFDSEVGTLPATGSGAPTREGHVFQGWSTTSGANNTVDFTAVNIWNSAGNGTVYAVWAPRADLTYIIKYYQDTFDESGYMTGNDSTAQGPVTFGTRVLLSSVQLDAHKPVGYQSGIQQGDALGYLIQVTGNVISVLYLPEGAVPYTVRYYKGSVSPANEIPDTSVTGTAVFNSTVTVTDIAAKQPAGYGPGTQSSGLISSMTENIINVIYPPLSNNNVDVGYYMEGLVAGTYSLIATDTITGFTTDAALVLPASGTGSLNNRQPANFAAGVIQPQSDSVVKPGTSHVIVHYDRPRNLAGSISYYRDTVDGAGFIQTDGLTNLVLGATYTPTQLLIDAHKPTGYVGTITPASRTVGMSGNTFEVLYLPSTNNTATVRYWKDSVGVGNQLGADVALTNLTFGVRYDALGIDVNLRQPVGYQAGIIQSATNTIGIVAANNIIDIIYLPRTDLEYTIRYYQDTLDLAGYMIGQDVGPVGPVTFGSRVLLNIAQLDAKKPYGYQSGVQQGDASGYLIQVSGNVISVLYLPIESVPYTVRYYKGSVAIANEIPNTSVEATGTFGATIAVTDMATKQPAGYGPGTQSSGLLSSTTENIINVIYQPLSNNDVAVGYYMEDVTAGQYSLIATDTISGFTTDAALVLPASGAGSLNHRQPANFTAGVIQAGSDTIVQPGTSHVIVHYDRPRNLAGSITYYRDTQDAAGLIQTDNLSSLVLGATYAPTQALIDAHKPTGYVATITPTSRTVAMTGNDFVVLYMPSTDNTATVRYYKDSVGAGNQLGADVSLTGLTFGTRYDAQGIDVNLRQPEGYQAGTIQSPATTITTVGTSNIINVVYLPRTDLTYIIKYYKDSVDAAGYMEGNDSSTQGPVTFGTRVVLTQAQLDAHQPYGYQSGRQQGDILGHLVQVSGNVISVLYIAENDIPYTVRYYKNSIAPANEIPNTSVEATATFGATITVTDMATKQPAGYGPGTQSSGLIASMTENIINVVYQALSNNNVEVGYYMEDITAGSYSLIATDTITGFTTDAALVLPASGTGSLNNRQPADFATGVIQPQSDTVVKPGTSHVVIHYARPRNLTATVDYYKMTIPASSSLIAPMNAPELLGSATLENLILGDTISLEPGTAPGQVDFMRQTGWGPGIADPAMLIVAATGNAFSVTYEHQLRPDPITAYTIVYHPGTTERVYNLPLGGSFDAGKRVTVASAPTRIGYRFLGYEITAVSSRDAGKFRTATYQSGATFTMPAANLKATALWQKVWPATFHPEGGTPVPGQTVDDGATIAVPTPPTREGYEFMGWYTRDGVLYDFSQPMEGPVELFAGWRKLSGSSPKTGDTMAASGIIAMLAAGVGVFVISRYWKRERTDSV